MQRIEVPETALKDCRNIEDIMYVFKVYGITPHEDLLWEIKNKNINVSENLLKVWEPDDDDKGVRE